MLTVWHLTVKEQDARDTQAKRFRYEQEQAAINAAASAMLAGFDARLEKVEVCR